MNAPQDRLDPTFIEAQRQRLAELREALLTTARNQEDEEAGVKEESSEGALEYEDDAQKLTLLEIEGVRVVRALERLKLVDRALEKIEEGTYGFSDVSAKPIPRERLVTVPEAICTIGEEQALKREARWPAGALSG